MNENERDYRAKIVSASAEMSKKEQLQFLDLTDAQSLDDLTKTEPYVIPVVSAYAVVNVHNEKSENKDYGVLVIVDGEGNRYKTGSESFKNAFMDFWDAMLDDAASWGVKCVRKPSKNYTGRDFLSCSII